MNKKVCVLGMMILIHIMIFAHPLLVTEVLPNPAKEPEEEWIEIHNPTGSPYCLDGWKVGDQEGQWIIPNPTAGDDYILYPGGYVTFANDADSFLAYYGYEPDLARTVGSTSAIQVTISGSVYLANTSDQVYLRDPTDSIIDCVQWGTTYESPPDSIYYPIAGGISEWDTYIRNPQGSEGTELNGEVSEQLSEVWTTSSAISEDFEGPNTGGFNPSGISGIMISNLMHNPASPSPIDTVQIGCKIKTDTLLTFVYMIHSTDGFLTADTSSMTQFNDTFYYDTIMPYSLSTRVKYYVSASNVNGDTVTSPISAPADYREYIVSEGSDFYEVHFNKSVDNSSAINWFAAGNDSMDWHMAKYIGSATKSVDACLYDLDRQIVADSLISAHNKGVSVRFITDADNRATAQTQQLETAGIPVIDDAFPSGYGGSNIMHNKFIVIDTQMVFSGSYNVTDNGTDKNANNSILIKDILIAENYTKEFVEMWGSETMTPNSGNSKFATSKTDNINHVYYIGDDTIKVYMSPSDGCASKMLDAIQTADHSIYFCIFTFSRQDVADAMKDRYDNHGVAVRGVFDAMAWNQTWSKSKDLRGDIDAVNPWSPPADIWVDSVDGDLLHHKYMLIDADDWTSNPIVITGSYNWSAAAEDGNDENMLIIHSRYFADLFLQEFAARYHEAGGDSTFSINTRIEDIALSVYRENNDVIINYDIMSSGFAGINVYFNKNMVLSSNQPSGRMVHNNAQGGIYTVKLTTYKGREVEIGSFTMAGADVLSFISQNRIFTDKRPYKAIVKSSMTTEVSLYNIAGECISKKNVEPHNAYIMNNDIPSGIYYVKFKAGGEELTDKIIKVR